MSDARAFERLVRQHQGAVCAVAFSVLRDRARSEEVAQDAFLIAWQKMPALAEPPQLPGWICGIARNLARNAARRNKEIAMDAESIATRTPLDAVLDHEVDDIAARALAALAEADREVVVLYYRGDGSVAQVAAALGIAEPAARQRLHRGRERLKSAAAAVEASLRATRPGPAFTAGCVAALAAGVLPSTAEAATSAPAASSAAIAGGVLALIGIGVGATMYASRDEEASRHLADSGSDPARTTAAVERRDTRASGASNKGMVRRIDTATRTVLVDAITAARQQRASAQAAPGTSVAKVYDFSGSVLDDVRKLPPPTLGPLSKATIRYAIQQIQPMLLECYTSAAPRLPRKTGTIGVTMRLVGEPDLGTVVESVTLGGDAHLLADPALSECMHETLMTIELAPMEISETWDVVYPFIVR